MKTWLALIIFLTTFIFVPKTYAQTTYKLLLDEYQQSFDQYIEAKNQYIEAKDQYLKYKTPVSRDEAIKVTQQFLEIRQPVLINYLAMIKERLEQSPELTKDELKPLITYINDETEFLESQIPLFNATNNLEDLVKLSHTTEKRYKNFRTKTYKMKEFIIISKVRALHKTSENLINLTTEQVARIRKEGILDTTNIDRWLIDAPEKLIFAKTNRQTALSLLKKTNKKNTTKTFRNLQKSLRKSSQYLRETNTLLLQIIQAIRFK